ncbi:hypothetical protein AB0F52_15235 [Amycolatopsis sp. NPDC024027]|uniref:hypothetical protein n=1 Tax=Amycolatopsis sp. NPDC024027 TaxID=3154327 RepID=UPI0033C0297C
MLRQRTTVTFSMRTATAAFAEELARAREEAAFGRLTDEQMLRRRPNEGSALISMIGWSL